MGTARPGLTRLLMEVSQSRRVLVGAVSEPGFDYDPSGDLDALVDLNSALYGDRDPLTPIVERSVGRLKKRVNGPR